MPKWHLYILECSDGTLYTGITNDLESRFKKHKSGQGAKYTRKGVNDLVYSENFDTKSKALKREKEIKKWRRKKKLALINL